MKFRIMTDGELFRVEKRTWGVWDGEQVEWGYGYYRMFNSYDDAKIYIRNTYGTSAEIVRYWRPA